MARIQPLRQVKHVREAQMVIEAIPEDSDMKRDCSCNSDRPAHRMTVLASNTSSISITRLGMASGHPDRVVGIHFMNPVPIMRLVEVVRASATSEDTLKLALALVRRAGKTPVVCQDSPGFIVNRVLMPMINEAIFALEADVATADAIDLAMVEGTNAPMGPLALADRIGLDTVLAHL